MLEHKNFTFYPEDYNALERQTKTVEVPVELMIELDSHLSLLKKLEYDSLEKYVEVTKDELEHKEEIIMDLIKMINSMFSIDCCTQRVTDEFLESNRKYLEKEFKRYIELREYLIDKDQINRLCATDFTELMIIRDLFIGKD